MKINIKDILVLLFLLAIAVGLGLIASNSSFFLLIPALLLFIFLLLYFTSVEKIRHKPILIVIWILIQPLIRIINMNYAIYLALQFISPVLFLYYYHLQNPQKRQLTLKICKPLIFLGLIFWGVLGISFIYQPFTRVDFVFLGELLTAYFFSFLPCVACENMEDVITLMKIMIFIGLLQFPIILAQAIGYADKLPAAFSQLSTVEWGGPINSVTQLVRYPGSFGDVELLAEFAGLVLIISFGLILIIQRQRLFWIIASSIIFAVGWFTGTRAFLVVTAAGLIVLLASLSFNSQIKIKQIMLSLMGSLALLSIVFSFIPTKVVNGFLGRFQDLQFIGNDAFNRAYLYNFAFSLLPNMPFWGFGSSMWSVFRQAALYNYTDPHSLYLWMLLYAGYPGLLTSVLLMLSLFIGAIRLSRQVYNKLVGQLGSIFLAGIVYLIANETKIVFLRSYFYANIIFFFFGLIAVTYGLGLNTKLQQNNYKM